MQGFFHFSPSQFPAARKPAGKEKARGNLLIKGFRWRLRLQTTASGRNGPKNPLPQAPYSRALAESGISKGRVAWVERKGEAPAKELF